MMKDKGRQFVPSLPSFISFMSFYVALVPTLSKHLFNTSYIPCTEIAVVNKSLS